MIGALKRRGVLGINRRNAHYTLAWNARRLYPLVDDKLATKRLCQAAGIAVPKLLAVARTHIDARRLLGTLSAEPAFVLKPARGAMGNGILVLEQRDGKLFRGARPYSREDFEYHAAGIISGLYSLAGHADVAMVEERLEIHPALAPLRDDGVPDIRVIVYRGVPVMCMMRLPTRLSGGRANLHQGAVGIGIDLVSGCATNAMLRGRRVETSPDTGKPLIGFELPDFDVVLHTAVAATDQTGLGYVGADVVLDARLGPVVLELNARPGLAIQLANRAGLLPRLDAVDAKLGAKEAEAEPLPLEERIALGRGLAARLSR
jgi:alpha-L-glutamate ligase-like protein